MKDLNEARVDPNPRKGEREEASVFPETKIVVINLKKDYLEILNSRPFSRLCFRSLKSNIKN